MSNFKNKIGTQNSFHQSLELDSGRRSADEPRSFYRRAMDDIEAELEAKLGNWRHEECVETVVASSAGPKKTVKRKRKKKLAPKKSAEENEGDDATIASLLPTTDASPEAITASLSRTLLQPREGCKWAAAPSLAGRISKRRREPKSRAGKSPTEEENEVNVARLVEKFRHEVGALGARGLRKRERKAYDEARLDALRFRPARNEKMPLTILEGRRRAEKKRAEKKKEKMKEEGVLLSKSKRNRR